MRGKTSSVCAAWAEVTAALCAAALVCGCASVGGSAARPVEHGETVVVDGGYTGPKRRVQLVELRLSDSLLALYPELRERRVGWGLGSRLVDALYETNRFTFVEDKAQVVNRIMQQWAMSLSGAVSESTAVQTGGLTAPEFLVYADVFDFAVSDAETVVGVASKKTRTTRIGVQVRLVNVQTGEYTPASGVGESAVVAGRVLWAATDEEFDQSTVGRASQAAINTAVNALVKRIAR